MAEDVVGKPARPSVIIVGGGLAGLAAASELCDRGFKVTLLEKRGFLGGRAFSFTDKTTGFEVDNGQHVFMRCCTRYIAFLKKLGVFQKTYLQDRMKVEIIDGTKGSSGLSSAPLPTPFHLLPSFVTYKHLSQREKVLVLVASLQIMAMGKQGRKELDGQTFYDWLKEHRQSERAIENFWNIIVLPSLNDDVRRVSANQALMVFQEGFFKDSRSADIGYSRVGLTSLIEDEAKRYITDRGGELVLKKEVDSLTLRDGRIESVALTGGDTLTAGFYVSAVPFQVFSSILPSELRDDPFFERPSRLESSPIVNVHVWYDRPVAPFEFAAFLNSKVQWAFNKSKMLNRKDWEGQYICLSQSGARDLIDIPKEDIQRMFLEELAGLLPRASGAKAVHVSVVKEPMATFSPAPGALSHRLPAVTPIGNLFLAGEWTDTDWPSTLEGAVRSGETAARELVQSHESTMNRS